MSGTSLPYEVELTPAAKRDLKGLNKTVEAEQFNSIDAKILALANNPRPVGSEKLAGGEGYRIRDGNYRIIYVIDDATRKVTIARVKDRKDAYRH